MGTLRDDLLDTTMVRMPDGSYLPQSQVRGMSASQIADLYKSMGGFGSTLDSGTGIQSAQEMFNQTYAEAMANEYLANILETQGVPDVVPFSTEDALRSVQVADGISQNEIDYVVGLLDQNLVTIDDVAAQTGIPAAEIQAVYNQIKGEPVVDVLNDPTNVTAGLINLTVGSNQMLDPETLTEAQAAAQAAAQSPTTSQDTDSASGANASLDSTVAADPDLTGSVDQTIQDLEEESSAEYKVGDIVTDDRIVGDYEYIYDAENNVFHYIPYDLEGNRVYRGTIDANTVGGFDPTQAKTGDSVAIMTDSVTGQLVVEHYGDGSTKTTDDTTDETGSNGSGLDITITGANNQNANTESTDATNNEDITDTGTNNQNDGGNNNAGNNTNNNGTGGGAWDSSGKVFTETVGSRQIGDGFIDNGGTTTVTKGTDGKDGTDGRDGQDGQDGQNGQDGQDGRDGKDGMIGMITSVVNQTPITDSILFEPKFTKLENVQQGMFGEFLRAAGGR